jgi:WS/DGAT/MGAT family acyltransferase
MTLRHGTEADLKATAATLLSANMDRNRPLWDFTLLRGLSGNRTAMVIRIHHCLVDGISGVGFLSAILDPSPEVQPLPKPEQPFHAPPPRNPSLLESLLESCISAAERVVAAESELLNMAEHLRAAGKPPSAEETNPEPGSNGARIPSVDELRRLMPELAAPADRLPFNVVCRGPQKFNWAEIPLAQLKAVKDACGTTVNDVVLTLVTSTVRRYVERHHLPLSGRRLRIVVPVNIRGEGDVSALGNRITFIPVNLPLDISDPRELLDAARQAMTRGKSAQLGAFVGLFGVLLGTVPTALQAILGPIVCQLPLSLCNLICTNVPGPKVPLYLIGHKMLAFYPYVPIGGEMGMNCAVLTYNGTAFFGFTGDAHAIPDLNCLDKLLSRSFAELWKAVGKSAPRPRRPRSKAKVASVPSPAPMDKPALADVAAVPLRPEAASKTEPEPAKALGSVVDA